MHYVSLIEIDLLGDVLGLSKTAEKMLALLLPVPLMSRDNRRRSLLMSPSLFGIPTMLPEYIRPTQAHIFDLS